MAAVTAGAKRPHAGSPKSASKKPTSKPTVAGNSSRTSLPSLLVSVMRSAGRPLTAKHLVQEVQRRGFKSSSPHFTKMVEARLWDLKKRGLVHRAADQPGYILAPSSNGAVPKPGPAKSPAQKGSKKPAAKAAKPSAGAKSLQKPLREVLTEVLKKKGTPLTGSQLAEEALKAGYKTTSKRFVDSIWTMLGTMDNVENVKGQGYRLKRAKA